ncbi:helix-turn-helix domain-containing protein [Streptomyces rubiginosohelvolus]|uniref:helix-turn-helix domain-containing protein n=1 Tax=Streptomyces rubiginosohelvolus TaxID=67362 RepID=UPI003659CEF0
MSKEAMDWALEYAPPMPSQLVATLSGLARHADTKGRGTYPSVARLAAYACKSERSVQRDLVELRKLGLIRYGDQSKANHLPEGKRPEVYDLALELTVPDGRAGRDEVTRASRVTLASSRRRGGKKKPSSDPVESGLTGDVDVRGDVDVTGDADVAEGVTSTSQEGRRPRHPNQLPEPKEEPKDSSSPTAQTDAAASTASLKVVPGAGARSKKQDEHLKDFGAFYLVYPKRVEPENAKKAWIAAMARGVDPKHVIAAATRYAHERKGQNSQYTKFPATWLNKGCYDDEPETPSYPHAVGDYQPWRNPEDQSSYYEEL